MMDGYKEISAILFCKNNDIALKPRDDTWLWTDAGDVTRHLTSMNSYHLWNLREYLSKHIKLPHVQKLKTDLQSVIDNITSVIESRKYDKDSYQMEYELYGGRDSKSLYDEEYAMFDGLWIFGSGIDNDEKWWFKYGYANE